MIRALRFRLVLVSMLSLVLVLGVIMGGLNFLNYRRIVQDADGVLSLLRDNGGSFPSVDEAYEWPRHGPRYRSAELPFEMRFFSAVLDGEGTVLSTDTARIAAVDPATAAEYAAQVWARGRTAGFSGIYRFLSCPEDGGTRVLFLDCGRSLSVFRNVLARSVGISAAGLATVFLLILLLSGRIVRPISQSYEKQRRFITDAGHEIRTPITIIDADAELVEMDCGPSEWLTDIRQQARRLAGLTNDLILLSRMEEPEKLTMIEFPLSDVVAETAASFQAPAMTGGKAFTVDVQPMLSFVGNEKNLRQLVSILLDNALKYSDEDGSIRLSLRRQGRSIVLEVENTVDSISRETIASMFDRFYRGDPSRSSRTRGYGIGLSIARAVVRAHRGRIAADSPDGKRLTVTVTLPAGQGKRGGEG